MYEVCTSYALRLRSVVRSYSHYAKNIVLLSHLYYKLLIQNREMYEQTHVIQKEVSDLSQVIKTFENRFKELETRHEKNSETIGDIKISVNKISKTSERIQNLDLDNNKTKE